MKIGVHKTYFSRHLLGANRIVTQLTQHASKNHQVRVGDSNPPVTETFGLRASRLSHYTARITSVSCSLLCRARVRILML